MTDLQMWSLIVGFFMPLAIALVQQPRWSNAARAAVMFVLCAVAGAVTAYLNGDLENGRSLVSSVLLVLVTTISMFKGLWKPTGVAPAIESATSPGTSVQP